MSISRRQVLEQLDQCAEEFNFPVLDNLHTDLADCRLTAFSNMQNWAVVIETIGWTPRYSDTEKINTKLYYFGNCVGEQLGLTEDTILFPVASGPSGPLLVDEERVNPLISDILIRSKVTAIRLDASFFANAQVSLRTPPKISGIEFLRGLVHSHRAELRATESELRRQGAILLPILLQLDEWRHPNVALEEVPSQTASFQMIAEALELADPSRYRPAAERPNTHWSNWLHK